MVERINFQKLSSLLFIIVLVHTKYKIKAKKMFKQESEETWQLNAMYDPKLAPGLERK